MIQRTPGGKLSTIARSNFNWRAFLFTSRVFSRDVMSAMLVSLNKKKRRPYWFPPNKKKGGHIGVPTNPPGIELYSHADIFFCFSWKTCSFITWVKTLRSECSFVARLVRFLWVFLLPCCKERLQIDRCCMEWLGGWKCRNTDFDSCLTLFSDTK